MHDSPIHLAKKPWCDAAWVGLVAWMVATPLLHLELSVALLLFAILFLVPATMRLIAVTAEPPLPARLERWRQRLHLPSALLVPVAFAMPVGLTSAALTLPWMLVTLLMAATGMAHARSRKMGWARSDQMGIDMAMVLVAVGGLWTGLWRLGAWPGGYPEVIAQLTAIHFHYIALIVPTVAGLVAHASGLRIARCILPMMVVTIALLAIGITFSPLVEVSAALVLIVTVSCVALLQLRVAIRADRPVVLTLLSISSLALLTGMGLAMLYTIGEYRAPSLGLAEYSGGGWIDIPQMIRLHGCTLAIGFALPAIVGWNLRRA